MKPVFAAFVLFSLLMAPGALHAQEQAAREQGPSGLPLPRFVSLASGEANMRTGPGEQYPIVWVYRREGWPLEITAEFGNWRKVRDHDGTQGWMHTALLSGRRTGLILGESVFLRAAPERGAAPTLRAGFGVVGIVEECAGGWCALEIGDHDGWLPQDGLWGVYPGEEIED